MNRRGDLGVIGRGDIVMGQMMVGEGWVNGKKDLDLEEGKAGYEWGGWRVSLGIGKERRVRRERHR